MKKKILISIWSDPSFYINLCFLINKLFQKYEIILICRKIKKSENFYYLVNNKKIKIIEIEGTGKWALIKYLLATIKLCIQNSFYICISVNFLSLITLSVTKILIRKKFKFYYYNFDFNLSKNIQFKTFLEKKALKFIDIIFIPSPSRLRIYKKNFKVKNKIVSIFNCYSKKFKPNINNKSKLKKILKNKFVVTRLGSYNSYHYLREIVSASSDLNKNIILVLAGHDYNNYFKKLNLYLKKKKILRSNLLLLGSINYTEWFYILKKASLGIAFYENINTSHNNMAGTSQKLNNYVFAGIPVLTNNNLEFRKYNKKYKNLLLVNPENINNISKTINAIYKNKKKYLKLKKQSKKAFLEEFNFEKQYKKIEYLF